MDLWQTVLHADQEAGIKLEFVQCMPVWEASPSFGHQKQVDRIRATIQPATTTDHATCECVHTADVYIKFSDGSLKRPDIAVFCREPDERHTAVTLLPEAVIEILSIGYEAKDWQIGVPFYISQGIRDVVVFDPESGTTTHFRDGKPTTLSSPASLTFACGCTCVV